MRKIAKAFYVLSNICSTIAILLILFLNAPKLFNIYPYNVVSGSMEPTIPKYSLVYLNRNYERQVVGDIIGFDYYDQVVIHRLVKIQEDGSMVTKGDANSLEDPFTTVKQDIIGKHVLTIPKVGLALKNMKQTDWLILTIWVTVINVIAIFAKNNYEF